MTPEFETLGLCSFCLSDDSPSFDRVSIRCPSLSREHTDAGFPAGNAGGEKEEKCHGTQDKSLLPVDCSSLVNKAFSSGTLVQVKSYGSGNHTVKSCVPLDEVRVVRGSSACSCPPYRSTA